MTHQEKIIVSAYTGYLMCDFSDVHKYIEEKLGRPVWTHEIADPKIRDEIHSATREDFLALCKEGTDADMTSIEDSARMRGFEEGYLQGLKDGRENG